MNGRRTAMLVLTLMSVLSGCSGGVAVAYKPPFIPVEFEIGTDGVFRATVGASITTFLGTFSVKSEASTPLAAGATRVSITHVVGDARHVDVNDIAENGSVVLCLDGRFAQIIDKDAIDIEVLDGTSTVRLGVPGATEPCRTDHRAPSVAAAAGPATVDVRGRWKGTYTCSQGETGLVLDIAGSSDALTATFGFHPIASDPHAASGSFTMTGRDVGGHLDLRRDHWIDRPAGYDMVDLGGDVGPGTDTITGTVVSATSGCSTFTVRRATGTPGSDVAAVVGTWTGTYSCSQGETGLRLTIAAAGSGITATFAFSALAANPDVPSGRFTMRGSFDDGVVVLTHDRWVVRPPGYSMVDLVSDTVSTSSMHGAVRGGGCDTFAVHRS